jgi:hypothetical protein
MTATTVFRTLLALPLLLLPLAACGSNGDDSGFEVRTTTQAAEPSAGIVVGGDWLVYFASEGFSGPTGTNFNLDADKLDQVAFAVNLRSREETNLQVAARGAVILGDEIYLTVDEALDGFDWDPTVIDADVLLHWSSTAGVVTRVDTLDLAFAGELPRVVDGRIYYSAVTTLAVTDETNLRSIDEAMPTTPVVVLNEAAAGNVRAHLVGEDEGLLFCVIDETDDGMIRNGDGDALDEHVLALLDGTNPSATLRNIGLALASDSDPLAARLLGANDWLVAFLVDEAFQGGTNFNDQALFTQPLLPESCALTPDMDALDQVLFFLDFKSGALNPVNTGLAGHERVLALDGFVATISSEADANCNLNADTGDTDSSDEVARWVSTDTSVPIAPAREADQLHALATSIAGGSRGLAVLDDRLVAVIDEAADDFDHDGKLADHELVAWLDPAVASAPWHFSHQASTANCCSPNPPNSCRFGTGVFDSDCDSEPFAGASWMAPEAVGNRLAMTFLEEVPGTNPNVSSLNNNLDCALEQKDTDKIDALPVWADFQSGPTLDFDGLAYAVDANNAGIEIAHDFAFFRVSEAADNHDYNGDGQLNDVVLFRNPLLSCDPVPMATSSVVPSQVITTDRDRGAAFLSSESQAGVDFNADGDMTDLVVRYFSF